MRVLLLPLAVLILLSCQEQKQQNAITYLSKTAVFNKDSLRDFLNTVPATQADSSKAVFLKGVGLLKNEKNTTAAIDAFIQSLQIYPSANTYYELGNACLETKDWQKALYAFELAESMDFSPLGNVLFKQASCYAEMDSSEKMYDYLKFAVQTGFVDRDKILNNPHFAKYKQEGYMLTVYNEAMSGNGDPEEIRWHGYLQDFKQASFPYKIDSGSFRKMGEPQIISYDYEKFVPEMRDHKFSRDVGSEYFYVARVMQTELCSVVLYGCRSYEYLGAPVYYILASFDSKGKMVDKMIVGGAKNFDDNYKEFSAQSNDRFHIQEYKNTYEKSTDENGYEDNKVISRTLVATHQYAIDGNGKFVTSQQG
jgi:tetratricopeptide (TPR) repeat protein